EQALFVPERQIEAGHGHADRRGQGGNRRALVAVPPEQPQGGVERLVLVELAWSSWGSRHFRGIARKLLTRVAKHYYSAHYRMQGPRSARVRGPSWNRACGRQDRGSGSASPSSRSLRCSSPWT